LLEVFILIPSLKFKGGDFDRAKMSD